MSGTNASTAEVTTHQARALPLRRVHVIKHMIMVPRQVRLKPIILLLLAPEEAHQRLQTCLKVLRRTRQGHKDVLLAPENRSHLRLVLVFHNQTPIVYHQCTPKIILHHAPIFQFHFCHHLLHLLMCLMHVRHAQAQEHRNTRMDKQFEKVKVFDGSKPSECHPWLEEVHTLCIQTGRPFRKMLLLCAGQAIRDFITDMSPGATDDQIKNDLITGYSDLQGLGCKQSTYDSIMQQPDEPLRSYIVRYSRLFKLLNGTALDDVRMRTTSMHFVNSLRNYLSSKVEDRLLGMNEKNYSLGDTFKVVLECELKAIASERRHAKRTMGSTN